MKLCAIFFALSVMVCRPIYSTAQRESSESEESLWDIFDDDDDGDSSEAKVEPKSSDLSTDTSSMNSNWDFGTIFSELATKVQTFFNETVGNILETVDTICEELTSDGGKEMKKDEDKKNAITDNSNTSKKPAEENPVNPEAGNTIVPPKGRDGVNDGASPPIGA